MKTIGYIISIWGIILTAGLAVWPELYWYAVGTMAASVLCMYIGDYNECQKADPSQSEGRKMGTGI